ncbi:MAG TPA: CARDB domain-containing protein [Burkholderiales bacterium]|nr:CARDB domain-containing protein [Burkholderiales bacterium]
MKTQVAIVARKGTVIAGLVLLLAGAARAQEAGQAAGSKADLAVSLKASSLLVPNQDVTITVTIKNQGSGPAPESDFDVIVKNGHAPREVVRTFKRKIRALTPGDKFSYSFKIKVALGLYEVCGTSDRKKKLDDADRTNNVACVMIEGK